MAGLSFTPYELLGNGSQKFSIDKFGLIDDSAKPCDKLAKSTNHLSQNVSQFHQEPSRMALSRVCLESHKFQRAKER